MRTDNRDDKWRLLKWWHSAWVRFWSWQSFWSKDKYKKISAVQKWRKLTEEHKQKLRWLRPKATWTLNHNWKWGISSDNDKIRHSLPMSYWKKSCLERDNLTCQISWQSWGILNVHHINNFSEFPELRFDINNGITLSKEVHILFHKKYWKWNNTREQLIDFANTYDGFVIGQNC